MKRWIGLISPLFLQATLGSNVPTDIMYRAAPVYDEVRWNGVLSGNQNLLKIYRSYPEAIEKITPLFYQNSDVSVKEMFSRNGTSSVEKTFFAMSALGSWEKAYGGRENLTQFLSSKLGLESFRLRFILHDLAAAAQDMRLQKQANCFVYAFNDPGVRPYSDMVAGYRATGIKSAPEGFAENASFEQYASWIVKNTESDGATFVGKKVTQKYGFYNVALYVKPPVENARNIYEGYDVHYVRQDRDGGWSHKLGELNVSRTDFGGKPILDPASADFRTENGNYIFVGYFLVPEGGLDVGSPYDPSTKPHSPPAHRPKFI